MWKKSEAFKEQFGEQDDGSIDFSVDPQMFEKLGIRKTKRGDQSAHDAERIFRFQLEKDKAKINKLQGSYGKRRALFESFRENDVTYKEMAHRPELGKDGQFEQIPHYTKEEAWRSTSQPYGEIAHKRSAQHYFCYYF